MRSSSVLSAFIGLATFAVFFKDVYLESYFDTDFVAVAGPTLLGLSAVALWEGIWAFANRLLTPAKSDWVTPTPGNRMRLLGLLGPRPYDTRPRADMTTSPDYQFDSLFR